ncbi:MAG: hypothetical protein IPF71_18570 [Rhodoferax sp.]|nr:hypothetical protein [Rhodoferax sp.]
MTRNYSTRAFFRQMPNALCKTATRSMSTFDSLTWAFEDWFDTHFPAYLTHCASGLKKN